jgi:peptidoglycan/xylan/chitin deacetylase (PgdA/CDA1 family)
MFARMLKEQIISRAFSKVPGSALGKLTRINPMIAYYHIVSDETEIPHIKHLYKHKNVKQFGDDIDFLVRNYSLVSLMDTLGHIKHGRPLPRNAFLLTFDDGFKEVSDIVAPILLKKGVPATFFVPTDFIDNEKLCYEHKASLLVERVGRVESVGLVSRMKEIFRERAIEVTDLKLAILSIGYAERDLLDEIAAVADLDDEDYLRTRRPYLSGEEIRGLLNHGFTVGAHSIDHPWYRALSLEDQLYQTLESVRVIRKMFCLDYGAFAFPHTDAGVSMEFFDQVLRGDGLDISFGNSGLLNDTVSTNLQRFSLEKPFLPAKRIIALQFARSVYKGLKGVDKVIRSFA